jgi:hypothetical protein
MNVAQPYDTPYSHSGLGVAKDEHQVVSIEPGNGASFADGDTLNLFGVTFEMNSGGGVTPGNVAVPFTALDTAAQVAASLASVLLANQTAMGATVTFTPPLESLVRRNVATTNAPPGEVGGFAVAGVVDNIIPGSPGTDMQPGRIGEALAMLPAPPDNREEPG